MPRGDEKKRKEENEVKIIESRKDWDES
jgi:hypothetical protein